MRPNYHTAPSRRIYWSISATALSLLIGGCVTCPDGSAGTVCYTAAGTPYYAPAYSGPAYSGPAYVPGPGYAAPAYAPAAAPYASYGTTVAPDSPPYPRPVMVPAGDLVPETGARPGHIPGVGVSYPLSPYASNIGPEDTRSTIAPTLPEPEAGRIASPRQFLMSAHDALLTGRTGEAQEAMERAQTRLLDRSTPLFQTDEPSNDAAVAAISQALHTLGAGDQGGALREVDTIIPHVP